MKIKGFEKDLKCRGFQFEIGKDEFTNEWFKPIYNWVLADAIEFDKPILAKGKLSFWDADNYLKE